MLNGSIFRKHSRNWFGCNTPQGRSAPGWAAGRVNETVLAAIESWQARTQAQVRWQRLQKKVLRCPITCLRIGIVHTRQGSPSRA